MTTPLKPILYVILIFGFLSTATETFRYIKIQSDLQEAIETIATDSMELAMNDDYREDNISTLDTTICRDMFYDHLQEAFNLDPNLKPLQDSYIKDFTLEELTITAGEYTLDNNDKPTQTENPTLYVKGFIKVKPFIIGINKLINIPFKFNSQNKRI